MGVFTHPDTTSIIISARKGRRPSQILPLPYAPKGALRPATSTQAGEGERAALNATSAATTLLHRLGGPAPLKPPRQKPFSRRRTTRTSSLRHLDMEPGKPWWFLAQ